MAKYMLATLLLFGLAACTIEGFEGNLQDGTFSVELSVDKNTAMSYTRMAMHQAGLSARHLVTDKQVAASPAFSSLAADEVTCAVVEETCSASEDKCVVAEDYTDCGSAYGGRITRTYEGQYDESYKVTVVFANYSEGVEADEDYFFFNGTTVLQGTIGLDSFTLTLNSTGKSKSHFDGTLEETDVSSTMTLTMNGDTLTMGGTQTGRFTSTDQSASMSISNLVFEEVCTTGPVNGSITFEMSGKQAVSHFNACGQAAMTIDGEEFPLATEELLDVFISPNQTGVGDMDKEDFCEEGFVLDGEECVEDEESGGNEGEPGEEVEVTAEALDGYWRYVYIEPCDNCMVDIMTWTFDWAPDTEYDGTFQAKGMHHSNAHFVPDSSSSRWVRYGNYSVNDGKLELYNVIFEECGYNEELGEYVNCGGIGSDSIQNLSLGADGEYIVIYEDRDFDEPYGRVYDFVQPDDLADKSFLGDWIWSSSGCEPDCNPSVDWFFDAENQTFDYEEWLDGSHAHISGLYRVTGGQLELDVLRRESGHLVWNSEEIFSLTITDPDQIVIEGHSLYSR